MKKGKDDEKVIGPMFPRLHVNDTEKGGPRAPPRNKMALYEQLSIPSQRFKPGVVPVTPTRTANPTSSSQVSGHQRNMFYSQPHPPSIECVETPACVYYDSSASFLPLEQTKQSEKDDFSVPIFMQSHVGQDIGKPFLSSPASTERPTKHLTNSNIEPMQTIAIGCNTRQEGRNQKDEKVREFIGAREQAVKAVTNSSSVDKAEVTLRQGDASISHILADCTANNSRRLHQTDEPLPSDYRVSSPINGRVLRDDVFIDPTRLRSNGDSVPIYDFHSEEQRILDDSESHEDKTSLPTAVADRDDGGSETSMVDSISGLDISPDDVVGIIGQKHFWKARRTIVNQQRVFAVQVFELHRLIKVQRMIAGSPHLLLEDSTYLGKPIKESSPAKLPIEYAVKGVSNGSKRKNDSEKPDHKIEFSAENTLGKASLSSVQNGSQLPGYKPSSVSSPAAAAGDHATSPWCFHQSQGHQWLIPVMSPSDGLVYKPYPGPGFMAPVCGGCGPPGSTPMMGNFFPPAYGVPATHHFQGMGVPPFAPPPGPQGYFPSYGMSALNQGITGSVVGPMRHFAASGLHGQQPQLAAKNIIQHQNSSNVPSQKKGPLVDVTKSQVSLDGDLQISTASTPSERLQGNGRTFTTEGSSVLPLFPTSPRVEAPSLHHNAQQPSEADRSAQVIKVVPHNGRLATESVARIFQSIQEERKHYDSV